MIPSTGKQTHLVLDTLVRSTSEYTDDTISLVVDLGRKLVLELIDAHVKFPFKSLEVALDDTIDIQFVLLPKLRNLLRFIFKVLASTTNNGARKPFLHPQELEALIVVLEYGILLLVLHVQPLVELTFLLRLHTLQHFHDANFLEQYAMRQGRDYSHLNADMSIIRNENTRRKSFTYSV
jgi:hypothetical protein